MKRFEATDIDQLTLPLSHTYAEKITSQNYTIGVVGLGYVGLPIALAYAKKGVSVIGVDVSEKKVQLLKEGENYIDDLDGAEIREVVEKDTFIPTTDYAQLSKCDAIYIAVPTPCTESREPDIRFIIAAGKGIAEHLQKGQLITLKSTTFPGTTEYHLAPVLEESGLKTGEDYFLAYSPERVDPGNTTHTTENTPIVVGGVTTDGTILAGLTLNQITTDIFMVSSPKIAETEKLLENTFRYVNIGLVNELALLCERAGLDVWEVIDAASTKPYGFMRFTPGPGVGGHCIPIDPHYLSAYASKYDFDMSFVDRAFAINDNMPHHLAKAIIREIAHQPVALSDAKILILGVSYKKNVGDIRHSPVEPLIRELVSEGLTVDISDPYVSEYCVDGVCSVSKEITPEMLKEYNCIILATHHNAFDVDQILAESTCTFIDTCYATKGITKYNGRVRILGKSPKNGFTATYF